MINKYELSNYTLNTVTVISSCQSEGHVECRDTGMSAKEH